MDSTANRAICLVTVPFVFVFSMLAQSASAQETAKGLLAITKRFGFCAASAIPTR
ncbi:MAG: hypothetical protein WBW11_16370 [Pseudolabrys sp.]|jgi:hypothetical protein